MQAYEKQKQALKSEGQLESKSEERERAEKFKQRENNIVSKPINPFTSGNKADKLQHETESKIWFYITCTDFLFLFIYLHAYLRFFR